MTANHSFLSCRGNQLMGGSPSGRGHLLAASTLAAIIVYLQKSGLGKHLPPPPRKTAPLRTLAGSSTFLHLLIISCVCAKVRLDANGLQMSPWRSRSQNKIVLIR